MKTLLFFSIICSLFFLGCPKDDSCTTCPTKQDTTSHVFTFQTFTWGGGGSSSINDVAIINDTNIWVVGEIQFSADSSYNAAHWDGQQWTFLNIPTEMFGGTTGHFRLNTIIAFSSNDIWTFSIAGSYSHWNGTVWDSKFVSERSGGGIKFWGTSSTNLYLVGTNGSITYYNGFTWQKVESGTTNYISDIYGAQNTKTGAWEILAVAEQSDTLPFQTQLLRIQGTSVSVVEEFSQIHFSIWFVPGEKYYLVGDGILWKNKLNEGTWNNNPMGTITQYGTGAIRGTGVNNIFCTGSYFEVVHYNGSTWHNYNDEIPSGLGTFGRVTIKGNTMVACGYFDQDAILLLGKR